MWPRTLARIVTSIAVTAATSTAFSQPPDMRPAKHSQKNAPKAAAAAVTAYLSGNQALVGLHARSTDPVTRDPTGRPVLALRTVNRGELLAIRAATDEGGFSAVDLDRVAHLLRAAGGEEHPIDPRVVALVYRIQTHFDAPEIRVVSGYRVPKAASHSNHGRGRAVDLIVPGTPDEDVAAFVRELGFVGVGVYPSSQFVHVDVRPRSYFWVDFSGPHKRNREHGILRDLAVKSDGAALADGRASIEPFVLANDVDAALSTYGALAPPTAPNDEEDEDQ